MYWSGRKFFFYAVEVAGFVFLLTALLGTIAWWLAVMILVVGYIGRTRS